MSRTNNELVTFVQYALLAEKTDRFKDEPKDVHYKKLSFGYFGEVGTLLSALKKVGRDQLETTEADQARIEIGDALWYLTNLAKLSGISATQLSKAGLANLRAIFGEKPLLTRGHVTFSQLHAVPIMHEARLATKKVALLRETGQQAGWLVSISLDEMEIMPAADRLVLLSQCLAQLAMLCASFKLTLMEVAVRNIEKTYDRWPQKEQYHLLPKRGKAYEQFEEAWDVVFTERKVGSRSVVVQQIHSLNIGDPLTDNSYEPDGYRYHDVFHFAYAAHLGWSPVLRALLKLKRKSNVQVDETDDGARAIIIEEGIATWIFNDAKGRKLYRHIEKGRLDLALLQQVRAMVQGFEVRDMPLWQWENAILDGFTVFRQLIKNKGGAVHVDLKHHKLTYSLERKPTS